MKRHTASWYICLIIIAISNHLLAQVGPGGVGHEDDTEEGQPHLLLWLKAEDLSSDGSPVSLWYDMSGNGHDAKKGDLNGPLFLEKGMKGMPCVFFDGSSWFKVEEQVHPGGLDGGQGLSIFFVVQPLAIDGGAGMKMITKRNHWNLWAAGLSKETCQYSFNLDFHGRDSSQYIMAHVNGNLPANKTETAAIHGDTSEILLVNYMYDGSISAIRVNGANTAGNKPNPNRSVSEVGPLEDYDNDLTIGAGKYEPQLAGDPGPVGDFLIAYVGEIAMYRTGLDSTRRLIVENYLAAKYGLDIGEDHRYKDSLYTSNLMAVGTLNSMDIHNEACNGVLTVTDKTGSIDQADEFLWIGDNGMEVEWVQSNVPQGWDARWSRIYRFEKNGNLEASLSFSFLEAGVSLLKNNEYTLLYADTHGADFTATDLVGSPKFGALNFKLTAEELKTGYYTIATRTASGVFRKKLNMENFRITTNPVSDLIQIENPNQIQVDRMILMDISGRVVWENLTGYSSKNTISFIPVHILADGMYLLNIFHAEGKNIYRIVKSN